MSSCRWEVEVELRNATTVRHVWVDEVDALTVRRRVRLLDDDLPDADGWWTVERIHGRRHAASVDGLAVPRVV